MNDRRIEIVFAKKKILNFNDFPCDFQLESWSNDGSIEYAFCTRQTLTIYITSLWVIASSKKKIADNKINVRKMSEWRNPDRVHSLFISFRAHARDSSSGFFAWFSLL